MQNHYMIDIETTGTDLKKDEVLEIALVEIRYKHPYWYPTGRVFHKTLHYSGKPQTAFAKKYMKKLYSRCNSISPDVNYKTVAKELKSFLHSNEDESPKFFMGWNASGFDLPFMYEKGLLERSYHAQLEDGSEELRGDVHYRVYEQTGALNMVMNMTGKTRKEVLKMSDGLNPTNTPLPAGKSHDALYDCYKQIINLNGQIKLGRECCTLVGRIKNAMSFIEAKVDQLFTKKGSKNE